MGTRRFVLTAAGLGFATGMATTFIWMLPGETLGSGSAATTGGAIKLIAPGLLFGLVLGAWINSKRHQGWVRVAGFALAVELAWFAAYFFAINVTDHWDGIWHKLAEIGVAAGFIGGLGMAVATALAFRFRLPPQSAIAMVVAGAAAGALLPADFTPEFLTPLFYVWQAVVAASVGWAAGQAEDA